MSGKIAHQKPTVLPVDRNSTFPKTAVFFDWGMFVIVRTQELVWEAKYLIFGGAFMLFLIYELAHFARFLFQNWKGS